MENSNGSRRWLIMVVLALVLGLAGGFFLTQAGGFFLTKAVAPASSLVAPTETPFSVESLPQVDVNALITIHSPADIEAKRRDVLNFIYGQPTLSSELPEVIENTELTRRGIDLTMLGDYKADMLRVSVPEGFVSYNYLFHAKQPNNQLVIYHLGHQSWADKADVRNFNAYLEAGYDLVIMNLPLFGPNVDKLTVETECCGPIALYSHEMMGWLERPVRPFILPVNEVVNYAVKQNYKYIYMTGISGGGWTTMMYGALDPRLKGIAPVAGSQPLWFYARNRLHQSMDFEQRIPALYSLAGYEELYVMGAYGNGKDRWSLFGFNLFDPCCFRGTTYEAYESTVQARLAELGAGEFSVVLDSQQRVHQYGKPILTAVMARMAKDGEAK